MSDETRLCWACAGDGYIETLMMGPHKCMTCDGTGWLPRRTGPKDGG